MIWFYEQAGLVFAWIAFVNFDLWFAEGFVNGNAVPLVLQREFKGVGGCGGGIHGEDEAGEFLRFYAGSVCDPWNAEVFDDRADVILVVPAMVGRDDDECGFEETVVFEGLNDIAQDFIALA